MSEPDVPATPAYDGAPQPQVPAPYQPQASWPGDPSAGGPTLPEQPKRRSKAWIWWTIGIVTAVLLTVGACAVPFYYFSDSAMPSVGFGDSIAVIYVDGVIAGTGDYYSGYITPEYFNDQLQQAVDDESVKAILLRVDSPGGTVAASEEIAQYVKECPKPVVVSVGDVDASGAYMISSQADEIWAMPGSAVGSIGVIAEIPNVAGLLDKVGVEFTVITAGEYKDAGSPYRPLTEEERGLIQGSVDEAYDQFIDIVAEGRGMKRTEVEELATGWVWGGSTAQELGLIDELGTFEDALDSAADLGKIEGEYDVVYFEPELGSPLDLLLGLTSRFQGADALTDVRGEITRRSLPR